MLLFPKGFLMLCEAGINVKDTNSATVGYLEVIHLITSQRAFPFVSILVSIFIYKW